MRRLKTDHIDLFQCHWRDNTTPLEETAEALAQLIKEGKILAAGVSNFKVEEIEAMNKIVPIASDQPPYSMVMRDIEKDILPYCQNNDIGVIVYSPLQRGLLTGKFNPDHKFGEGDHRATQPHFQPDFIKRTNQFLAEIKPIAERHSATISQVVLNWTIHRAGVTVALVGARDAEQARQNAKSVDVRLSDKELHEISRLLDLFTFSSAAK